VGSGAGRRDAKKARRERTPRERKKTPPELVKKEEPAVHSGSEEGEIEEE
jgi:pre-mRNA-processing factor 40